MRRRLIEKWMDMGVTFIDPQNTYIDKDVKIGNDTIIYPGVIFKRENKIGEDCIIGHNCRIEDSQIEDKVEIQASTILQSFVGEACHIGLMHIWQGSKLGKNVKRSGIL